MSSDERSRERIALNEALFRDVNARIAQTDSASGEVDALCECGDLNCKAPIRLTAEEYASVRSDRRQFAVVPGHEIPDVEDVVASTDRFYTVRKKVGEEYLARRNSPKPAE